MPADPGRSVFRPGSAVPEVGQTISPCSKGAKIWRPDRESLGSAPCAFRSGPLRRFGAHRFTAGRGAHAQLLHRAARPTAACAGRSATGELLTADIPRSAALAPGTATAPAAGGGPLRANRAVRGRRARAEPPTSVFVGAARGHRGGRRAVGDRNRRRSGGTHGAGRGSGGRLSAAHACGPTPGGGQRDHFALPTRPYLHRAGRSGGMRRFSRARWPRHLPVARAGGTLSEGWVPGAQPGKTHSAPAWWMCGPPGACLAWSVSRTWSACTEGTRTGA